MSDVDRFLQQAKIGSHIIVKLAPGEYFAWSSVGDAPYSYMMRDAETRRCMRAADKHSGSPSFERRWKRLEEIGTTEMIASSVDVSVRVNRAGPNEECITIDAMRRMYRSADARQKFKLKLEDIVVFADDLLRDNWTSDETRRIIRMRLREVGVADVDLISTDDALIAALHKATPDSALKLEAELRALTSAENQ